MASAPERAAAEGNRGRLLELLLRGAVAGPDRDPLVFVPVLLGLVGPSRGGEGDASPPPVADRIVLVNPLTQGMVVLRAGGGGPDLAGLMQEMLGTDEGARGPPPASRESIEAMREVERPTGDGGEEEECAVCLDELWPAAAAEGKSEVVKEMPCRHKFHGGCIGKWLGMHGSCPVCRYRMPEEEPPERKKEGEEGERRRRRRPGLEREIWVTLGFGRSVAEQQQHQQQEQHAMDDEEEELDPDES